MRKRRRAAGSVVVMSDWDPAGYLDLIRSEVPDYDLLQEKLVDATRDVAARSILELGVGSGETARRILAAHPEASLVGLDSSPEMLEAARAALPPGRAVLESGRLEDPLPTGPFDLVVSALAVHHLEGEAKAGLFRRIASAMAPGARFVLADVVVPENPAEAVVPIEAGYDFPSTVTEQVEWLGAAGLAARVAWRRRDLAVVVADAPMQKRAEFRFYAELNDFLPASKQFRTVVRTFELSPSVKDMIEAQGVPHTEVDLVIANGESVDFAYRVRDGDRIGVYPVFESFDLAAVTRLRPEPLREPRFIVDANLGALARHLRLVGFDTLYDRDWDDAQLAETSRAERRILLTRDVGLLKRTEVTHGYFVREQDPRAQIREVARRLQLLSSFKPFTRCLECNGELVAVTKEDVAGDIDEGTKRRHDDFRRCSGCTRVYWRGSHHERLSAVVAEIRFELGSG